MVDMGSHVSPLSPIRGGEASFKPVVRGPHNEDKRLNSLVRSVKYVRVYSYGTAKRPKG